jgi:protein-disulfide isomerase
MMKTRDILIIFIPAIIIVVFFLSRVMSLSPFRDQVTNRALTDNERSITAPVLSPSDGVIGPRGARYTIVSYMDVSCTHCADEFSILEDLMSTHPRDIRFVMKPISTIDTSRSAHAYLYCAHEQGVFAPLLRIIFQNQSSIGSNALSGYAGVVDIDRIELDTCMTSNRPGKYAESIAREARSLGVSSVPTTYLNGIVIDTPQSLSDWETLLSL